MVDIKLFEVWLHEHRPALVQYFEHADAIRALGGKSNGKRKWQPTIQPDAEVRFVGEAVSSGFTTIMINGQRVAGITEIK